MNRMIKNFAVFYAFIAFLIAGVPVMAGDAGSGGAPLGAAVASAQQAYAKQVTIAPFSLNGVSLTQDRGDVPEAFKNPASRKCKPFCVQKEQIADTTTIKVGDFPSMAADINSGNILLVDMRTKKWYAKGTLPGAVSLPYSTLTGKKTKAKARMKKLNDKAIIGFCNGWWCGQSPTGLNAMKKLGYQGKLYYFRGGVQDWVDAGLPLVR